MLKKLLLIIVLLFVIWVGARATFMGLSQHGVRTSPTNRAPDSPASIQMAWSKDLARILNECADVLETVKDTETAEVAAPKLDKLTAGMEALVIRQKSLPKLTQADFDYVLKETTPFMQQAGQRVQLLGQRALERSGGNEAYRMAVTRLGTATAKLQTE